MKRNKELKYLDKLFKKMLIHFNDFVFSQNQEALHAFRVQIKKTKSFLTLLAVDKKNRILLKKFDPVKKVFKSAGKIRDAYIHQKQGKENNIITAEFYIEQKRLQNDQTNNFLKNQHKFFIKIKKTRSRLKHGLRKISKHQIEQYLTKEIDRTKIILKNHEFTEQLHTGRKMLKNILYNQKLIPNVALANLRINVKQVDELQHIIGEWHDNKLALTFFKKTIPDKNFILMKRKQTKLKNKITEQQRNF